MIQELYKKYILNNTESILLCLFVLLFYFEPYLNICIFLSLLIMKIYKYTKVEFEIKIFLKPIDNEDKQSDSGSVLTVEYNSENEDHQLKFNINKND